MPHHHVLASRNTVIAGLQRFCWLIERTTRVTSIYSRARLKYVVLPSCRLPEVAHCVTHRYPGFSRWWLQNRT